jgi:MFS family permease
MLGTRPSQVPAFRRLAISYGVNEFGDNFALIALAVLVFDQTGSALATAALFVAAKFAPAFVAPLVTARVDRLAPRVALPAIYSVEALVFGALALIAATSFSLAIVLLLAFIDGTLALTGRGLSRAAVAAVLGPTGGLRSGNALLNVIFSVTSAAGPAVAGVFVATASVAAALGVDAVSFALVALILGTARGLPPARVEPPEAWLSRVRSGLRYVRGNAVLRTLISAQALAIIFFTLVVPIEVVYAKESLDSGDAGFGALVASWGVGMIVGSLIFARVKTWSTARLVGVSTVLIGLGYLGMSAAPGIVAGCAAAVVGGIGNGVQWVAVVTAVQETASDEFQARIVGLLESVSAAAPGIGFVLGGALTSLWSPRVAFLVAGVGVILVAAAMTRRLASA